MSDADQVLMTSGAFSRRSRLSPKALRLYEEKGLLKPISIDPNNGYRYYGERQIEQARLIGLLRRLDMPLSQISEVAALDANDAVKAIGTYWQGVETAHGSQRELARYLIGHLSGRGDIMHTVETRAVEAQRVATIEERVLAPGLPEFIGRAMTTIHQALREQGAETGVPFVAYHGEVNLDADGPVEVCVPYFGDVEPAGAIRTRIEPAHEEAFARITKAEVEFPRILDAYISVERWVSENDWKVSGSPREVYFVDFDAAKPEDPACDITFPYETR